MVRKFWLWILAVVLLLFIGGLVAAYGRFRVNQHQCRQLQGIFETWIDTLDTSPREGLMFPKRADVNTYVSPNVVGYDPSTIKNFLIGSEAQFILRFRAAHTTPGLEQKVFESWLILSDFSEVNPVEDNHPVGIDRFDWDTYTSIAIDDVLLVIAYRLDGVVQAKYYAIKYSDLDALPLLGSLAVVLGFMQPEQSQLQWGKMFRTFWDIANTHCPSWKKTRIAADLTSNS